VIPWIFNHATERDGFRVRLSKVVLKPADLNRPVPKRAGRKQFPAKALLSSTANPSNHSS